MSFSLKERQSSLKSSRLAYRSHPGRGVIDLHHCRVRNQDPRLRSFLTQKKNKAAVKEVERNLTDRDFFGKRSLFIARLNEGKVWGDMYCSDTVAVESRY